MVIVVKDACIQIDKLQLGTYGTNAYVLTCLQTKESVVVDAPAEADKIMESLAGTKPKYILLTHSHRDHTGALIELKTRLQIPLAAHSADAADLPVPPDIRLNDGDTISFGKIRLEVLHTPGHTPGSLCFKTGKYLLAGDTIFPGGPGHTKTPAALKQLIESLETKIFPLDDQTQLLPGHGDATTVSQAKAEFTVFSSRPHDPNLCGDVLWLSS